MTLGIISIIFGLVALIWSADRFVTSSASIARYFNVPALLIGIIVVGFGTSMPEMAVSVFAAINGSSGISIGNVYGSNIANIALIIGISAILSPIIVKSKIIHNELPILCGTVFLVIWQCHDGKISLVDGLFLLSFFIILMTWITLKGLRKNDVLNKEISKEISSEIKISTKEINLAFFWLITGLILLIVSSNFVVWGASRIATILGINDLVIGLTIIAVGTSMPELTSSIIAVRKGETDLALGNIIGSNLFNTLLVVGLSSTISPITITSQIFFRDIITMSGLTFLLFIFGYNGRISKLNGFILFSCFVGYNIMLVVTTIISKLNS